ncbi:MAG: MBL fold metallo-hydrolase [Robiginitomaculum sp.]
MISTQLDLRIIPVTPLSQNCSLLWDTISKKGVLVDPGGESEKILQTVKELGVSIVEIWLTHGHLDHAGGAEDVKAAYGCPIIGPHKDDQFWMDQISKDWKKYGQEGMGRDCKPDRYLKDGDVLAIGGVLFQVVHCPGHTPGHVVIYNKDMKIAFVGDVIFKGSVGRTDFPKSNPQQLIDSITEKLWPLGNDMSFIPGHGPMSTFGDERKNNPFVGDTVVGDGKGRSSGIL